MRTGTSAEHLLVGTRLRLLFHCSAVPADSEFKRNFRLILSSLNQMKSFPLYLNGELTFTEKVAVVIDPATAEPIGRMSLITRPTLAKAIQDAHAAFAGWRHMPGKARGELLHLIANELHRRRDEVARL